VEVAGIAVVNFNQKEAFVAPLAGLPLTDSNQELSGFKKEPPESFEKNRMFPRSLPSYEV
jgi:hypothetical protein